MYVPYSYMMYSTIRVYLYTHVYNTCIPVYTRVHSINSCTCTCIQEPMRAEKLYACIVHCHAFHLIMYTVHVYMYLHNYVLLLTMMSYYFITGFSVAADNFNLIDMAQVSAYIYIHVCACTLYIHVRTLYM